jgi:hypothetical protein
LNTAYVQGQSTEYGEFKPALLTAIGPTSYATAGDTVYNPASGDYINFPMNCTSQSGNYEVRFVPTTAGVIRAGAPSPSQSGWTAIWVYADAGGTSGVNSVTIATAGTGQTNGTYTITDSGTNFTGTAAKVSITIAGGAITKATVVNPGSGYFGAATFTVAEGGTPGTLTSTIGSYSGFAVASGTNLSGETLQFGAIVSQL